MQLHDIFPTIDTTWYLLMFGAMALFVALLLLWVFWQWRKRKKKKTRPYYLAILSECDYHDAKRTAHQLSYYGKYVVRTPKDKAKLLHLINTLTPYKYHKETTALPLEIQAEIKSFLTHLRAKDV